MALTLTPNTTDATDTPATVPGLTVEQAVRLQICMQMLSSRAAGSDMIVQSADTISNFVLNGTTTTTETK